MSRDWNIVDDSAEPPEPAPSDDTRLNAERVRRIVAERRAAHRLRMLRRGVAVLVLMTIAIVIAWFARRP